MDKSYERPTVGPFTAEQLTATARMLTEDPGTRVVIGPARSGPGVDANAKIIFLPAARDPSKGTLAIARFYLDHECAHMKWSNPTLPEQVHKEHGRAVFAILDGIEDARVNYKMGQAFAGAEDNIELGIPAVERHYMKSVKPEDPPQSLATQACLQAFNQASGLHYFPTLITDEVRKKVAEAAPDLHSIVRDEATTSEDLVPHALAIARAMMEDEPPTPPNGQNEDQPPDDPPPQPDGEGDGDQSDDSQSDGAAEGGNAPDGKKFDDMPTRTPSDISSDALAQSSATDEARSVGNDAPIDEARSVGVNDAPIDMVPEECTAHGTEYMRRADPSPCVLDAQDRIMLDVGNTLARRLASVDKSRWVSDRHRGDIDLVKLAEFASGVPSRPMKQKVVDRAPTTEVILMMDISCSMCEYEDTKHGDMTRIACAAAVTGAFTQILKAARYPVEVWAYQSECNDCDVMHVAWPNDHWKVARDRMAGIRPEGGTPTCGALAFGLRRLRKQSDAKRKVMILITDGEPDGANRAREACDRMIAHYGKMGVSAAIIAMCSWESEEWCRKSPYWVYVPSIDDVGAATVNSLADALGM